MARARNIKPSFFTNEILGQLDPIICMTFAGLWCLADREGRLEDRPLRVKAELFPYRESLDINGYLTVLEQNGFIDRYEVDGIRYIQVMNFEKHQTPHHTEKSKGYPRKPAPDIDNGYLTVKQRCKDSENKVPERSDSLIPDSLIPDSLIPDSLIPCNKQKPTQGPPAKTPDITLDKFLEQRKAEGLSTIEPEDPVWGVIDSLGMPEEFAIIQWRYLERQYSAKQNGKAKRYKQWPLVLKKSLAELWGGLFYKAESGWALTAKGKNLKELTDGQ